MTQSPHKPPRFVKTQPDVKPQPTQVIREDTPDLSTPSPQGTPPPPPPEIAYKVVENKQRHDQLRFMVRKSKTCSLNNTCFSIDI